MAEKNVNVRLVATGGGQVRAELAGIGDAGDDAFAKVGAGATAASGKLRAVGGAAEQAGRGAANAANGGLRQTTMQLSQVAQQASATGNWVQAFAIQLPDLALAFGPVGIAVGAVAGALLTLAPSLLGAGDAAKEMQDKLDAAEQATKDMVAAVKAADTPLLILQQRYGELGNAIHSASNMMASFMAIQAKRDVVGVANNLAAAAGFGSDLFLQVPDVDADDIGSPGQRTQLLIRQRQAMDNLRDETGATAEQAERLKAAIADMNQSSTLGEVIEDGHNLMSVLIQVHATADDEQRETLEKWANNVSATMQVAQDQIDAEAAARNRLLDTYDKNSQQMIRLNDDLRLAEAERTKAVDAGLTEEAARWGKLAEVIRGSIADAKRAAYEVGVAFTRTGDGFSTWYDKMRGGPAPYQGEMDQAAVTQDAISLIKKFEGFSKTPYWDVNAYRAGFGSDTVTLADGTVQRIVQGMSVSLEDANRDLARRVLEFQRGIINEIGQGRWSQFDGGQQAALTSIAYNYGSLPDRIVEAVRTGTSQDIATAVGRLAGDNGGINATRRMREASAFGGTDVASAELQAAQKAAAAAATAAAAPDALDAALKTAMQMQDVSAEIVETVIAQESAWSQVGDTINQSLYSAIKSGKDLDDILKDVVLSLGDMALQALTLGQGPLAKGGGGGGLLSGLIGAAFGGGDPLTAALAGAGAPVARGGFMSGLGRLAAQAMHVTVGVDPNNGNITAFTQRQVSAGMRQADAMMPSRVTSINRDPLRR